jgi:tetratricopeptide (TPR) repeat protein
MYSAAILGIASLVPGLELPGALGAIAGGIGVEAIGSIIERVANSDKLPDTEIQRQVEEAITQSGIDRLLTEREFYHAFARLLREQKNLDVRNNQILQILNHLEDSVLQLREKASHFTSSAIPKSPRPYFPHSYPLQINFTGRITERQMLSDWLKEDLSPVLLLLAIGGMGKSSLAWYWLQNDIDRSSLDGVMWWSFYESESSFSRFLDHAIAYFSGATLDPAILPTNYDKEHALIALLQQQKTLLVLDGFERQLRSFASLKGPFQHDKSVDLTAHARSCVDQNAARFLRDLVAGTTMAKVLITTRLMIHDLEDSAGFPLRGCRKEELRGLHHEDTLTFMRTQGVQKGTDLELRAVCQSYGNHPLSLRLLSGLVVRDKRNPRDISTAPSHSVHVDLIARRHHILEVSYNSLPKSMQNLLSRMSAFRTPIKYDTLSIFNDFGNNAEFDTALDELINRGLVFFDLQDNYFDLHPVVRAYAYDRLQNKESVHARLRDYFSKIPLRRTPSSMEDITPIIELLFHNVGAGCFDDAFVAYRLNQMNYTLRYWGQHELALSLLTPMLDAWLDGRWNASAYQRAWLLNEKGVQLMFLGKLAKAEEAFGSAIEWYAIDSNIELQANGWMNVSYVRSEMGDFRGALEALEVSKNLAGQIGLDNGLRYRISSGRYHLMLGDFEIAIRDLEEGIVEANSKKAHRAESTGRISRGEYYVREGEAHKALFDFDRCLTLARMEQQRDYEGRALIGLADSYRLDREFDKARRLLDEAKYVVNQTGFQDVEVLLWVSYAKLAYMLGTKHDVEDFALKALEIAERCGYRVQATEALLLLARHTQMRESMAQEYLSRAAKLVEFTHHYWTSLEVSNLTRES